MLGSVRFAQHSGKHPAQLRDMVTSPGGTSAAALHALEAGRLRTVLADAVWAAYRRTQSLAEGLSVKATTQREKEKEK
jgi:pyrroline-5-carboxylate reductase